MSRFLRCNSCKKRRHNIYVMPRLFAAARSQKDWRYLPFSNVNSGFKMVLLSDFNSGAVYL